MVKGVERRIIEIRDNGSGYFDRALFFVKAELPLPPAEPTLAGEAARIIDRFCLAKKGRRWQIRALLPAILRYAACVAGGAGGATLFWLLGGGHFH